MTEQPRWLRVGLVVEGQTEERFVRDVLREVLERRYVQLDVKILETSRDASGRAYLGGHAGKFSVIKNTVQPMLASNYDVVTTLIDLYRYPADAPGQPLAPGVRGPRAAEQLERALRDDLALGRRFSPFLIVHEFEALLFAQPDSIAQAIEQPETIEPLRAIRAAFDSPEAINHDKPPAKRIAELFPRYRKPLHGIDAFVAMGGIEPVRAECPRFARWLCWLEGRKYLGEIPWWDSSLPSSRGAGFEG